MALVSLVLTRFHSVDDDRLVLATGRCLPNIPSMADDIFSQPPLLVPKTFSNPLKPSRMPLFWDSACLCDQEKKG